MPTIPGRFLDNIAPLLQGADDRQSFLEAAQRPLSLSLRVNTNRIDCTEFRDMAAGWDWQPEPVPFLNEGFVVHGARDAGIRLEHRLGLYYIQEVASMVPPEVLHRLAPAASRLCDLCAAPGSKTTQMSSLWPDADIILANEPVGGRLKILAANLLRCRCPQVVCTQSAGERLIPLLNNMFDAVLVDAPCSGEGTMRRDRQALRGWNLKRFRAIRRKQKELLETAFQITAPGGFLVYSTCALSPQENQEAVADLLERHQGELECVDLSEVIPELARSASAFGSLWIAPHHYDTGGFFVAGLRRLGESVAACHVNQEESAMPHWAEEFGSTWGVDLRLLHGSWLIHEDQAFLCPRGTSQLSRRLRLNRPGIRMARWSGERWIPDQEFALAFGHLFSDHCVELDRAQAIHFLYGNAPQETAGLTSGTTPILLRHRGHPLGFCQWDGRRLNNLLGRSFLATSLK